MKLSLLLLPIAIILFAENSRAQIKIPGALKQAANSLSQSGAPSQLEIGSALKEALEIGVSAGTDRLSIQNGFLGNAAVKLLFPPEAQKVEKSLRGLGLNKPCDDFITSMNRAAELAVKEAKPIFISALQQMTLQDATNILLSKEKNTATTYFQRVTSDALSAKFQPIISEALKKTEATKYWTDLSSSYNKVPFVTKVQTDLTAYATQKAMDGLFYEVAQEELKIRSNSGARSTALLRKVFGYADGK
ncbi:MAG: DUF4197 domain-containing protein [Daejeonella sp.]|uniref:DUF4197 domain-containing protein n=1 Tax=Daejeonella sp. TaxID=2805397 RepID=UPI003C78EE43